MKRIINGIPTDLAPAEAAALAAEWDAWNAPEAAAAREWAAVRARRNQLLRDCDFTQLPDTPRDKVLWAAYRKALRDITLQPDPFALEWPTPPEAL